MRVTGAGQHALLVRELAVLCSSSSFTKMCEDAWIVKSYQVVHGLIVKWHFHINGFWKALHKNRDKHKELNLPSFPQHLHRWDYLVCSLGYFEENRFSVTEELQFRTSQNWKRSAEVSRINSWDLHVFVLMFWGILWYCRLKGYRVGTCLWTPRWS